MGSFDHSKKHITVVGSVNYDILIKQDHLPLRGETAVAESMSFQGGGKGANQAVQAARLKDNVYLVAGIGMDSFGDILLKDLRTYPLHLQAVKRYDTNSGVGVVNILNDGSVFATISTGANFEINEEHINEFEEIIRESRIVILQLEIPLNIVEYTISLARKYDCYVILNAAPAKRIPLDLLAKVNCLIVNEIEASFYTEMRIDDRKSAEENIQKLHDMVKDVVIITLGDQGSLCFDGQEKHFVEAFKVDAQDSTGAGDSFIGAFATKLFDGATLLDACEFATAASALTVCGVGAQGTMPSLDEIKTFVEKYENRV